MHSVHPPCAYLAQDLDPRIMRISFFSLIGVNISQLFHSKSFKCNKENIFDEGTAFL